METTLYNVTVTASGDLVDTSVYITLTVTLGHRVIDPHSCLLFTSDAAVQRSSVYLCDSRRLYKKETPTHLP